MIRRANVSEVESLSDIAYRSKAHWGYTREFMDACRDELTLSAEFVRANRVYVLEVL